MKYSKKDKEILFKYMGWDSEGNPTDWRPIKSPYPFDANEVLDAVNAMYKNGDWNNFLEYGFGMNKLYDAEFVYWLMQPDNFFPLMIKWLKRKK